MKHAGLILTQVVVVVGALAIYHLLFHGGSAAPTGDGPHGDLEGTALDERREMDVQLTNAEAVFTESYDEQAMRALVRKAGLDLTAEQTEAVLPMLHDHLLALRRNMQEARAAALAGKPDAQRVVYRARAAQALGAAQRNLQGVLSAEQTMALLRVCPTMMPPVPGSTATGKTKPISEDGRITTTTTTVEPK